MALTLKYHPQMQQCRYHLSIHWCQYLLTWLASAGVELQLKTAFVVYAISVSTRGGAINSCQHNTVTCNIQVLVTS